MAIRGLSGQYDPPADYGIENPLGPRTHNWKGGLLNEGSLYHGPVYTRPMYQMPWMQRPLNGLGTYVKTRNGLFANEGHGGGVFNYNTAFGSYSPDEAQGIPGIQSYRDGSLGALPANKPIPSNCTSKGFKDCYAVAKSEAQSKCAWCKDHQDDPQCLFFTTEADCVERVANNTAWDLCVSLYCKESNPTPTTYSFKDYKAGDPCSSKNTIQNVQHMVGTKADGIWGPNSQSSYETQVRVQGTKYCDLVPGCTGPTPVGGNCGAAAPVPAPTNPTPQPEPEPEDDLEIEPAPAHKEGNMMLIGGILLLFAGAAYAVSQGKKKGRRG